ncbi:MAG: hypothetical protein NMNS01_14400 [Nitrosomonas sp.]|nr:MAG: hypothetical protein NMNS01_14400 [Nitrosomonas sp.]
MRKINVIFFIVALLAMIANSSVLARGASGGGGGYHGGGHSHGHSHVYLGFNYGGFYDPGFYGYGYPFYYPPYYAYPPTVIVPTEPPVYIQKEQPQPAQPQANFWYYCENPDGYYPYVKKCPNGWQPVSPHPPTQ